MVNEAGGRSFPTTAWSIVQALREGENVQFTVAFNRFVASYWKPIYCFLRARGYSAQNAEDLTQEFFERFWARSWQMDARADRGKFRTYLLTILTRFLADKGSRAPRQDKFESNLVALSALIRTEERSYEPPTNETPEAIFMRCWAQAVLDAALRSLRNWCAKQGRPDWYRLFRYSHFPSPGSRAFTQEELAARYRLTRDQVRYGITTTSTKFGEFLRREVADQVSSQQDIEDEIRDLKRLLEDH